MSASSDPTPFAAIDIGTNTALLLVGRRRLGGEMEIVEDACRTPRLGAGLASTGCLAPEAIERGLTVLEEFAGRLQTLGVRPEHTRAVGTAALRRAQNSRAFVAEAAVRAGIAVEVISEDEEARLGYAAVIGSGASRASTIVDVGGGSTEVVTDGGASRVSLPIGAVVLTERWLGDDDQRAWPDDAWRALLGELGNVVTGLTAVSGEAAREPAVVLGGSAANLGCLELGAPAFDARASDGVELDRKRVPFWAERLRVLSPGERASFPIERERVAILPAGLACLAAVVERLQLSKLRVCGRGLRHAVLSELLGRSVG